MIGIYFWMYLTEKFMLYLSGLLHSVDVEGEGGEGGGRGDRDGEDM